jgi:mannose-6-phosphate isomerase-like protein (cupin superfamily)
MERINESEKAFRNVDSGVKYLFRGPKLDLGVILLKPGEKMGVHGHDQVEEIFYFIQGSPKMLINDVPHSVREGDAFRIDPLEKHDIHNDTDSPVKVVFIKCPYLPDDKISYDSNE